MGDRVQSKLPASSQRSGGLRWIVPGWGRLPRWMRLLLLAIASALAVDAAILAVFTMKQPAPPPLSPVFTSARVIRELQRMAAEQPNDPEWQIRLGQAYLREGHYLSAVDALKSAARLGGPENVIRWALAICYSNLDRHDEALEHLRRLSELIPRNLGIRLQTASELAHLQQTARAREVLDSIPPDAVGFYGENIPGSRHSAIEQLAESYAELEVWDRALALAQSVLREAPGRDMAHYMAGRALVQLRQPSRAVQHLREALRATPNDPGRQFHLAQALLQHQRPGSREEAVRLLEAVARADSPPGETFFSLGLIYERRREWAKAAESFARAHNVRIMTVQSLQHAYRDFFRAGRQEDGLYVKGLYYETLQQFPQAIVAYRQLARIHSCCHSGYMHMARAQKQMGQVRLALSSLLQASKLPNPPPKLYAELAQAYDAIRDLKNEQAMWWKFIRLDPDNADVGYQHLGALADGAGKLDEAERLYRKCVELQPGADLYRVRLARLLLQRRSDGARLREAVTHLERAIVLGREYADGYFHLGIAYRYAGRNMEAIWALRHAIDLDPGDGKAYQPLGELLIAAGKREEGQQTLAMFTRYRDFFQTWETLRARANRNPRDVEAQRRMAAFYDHAGAHFDAINAHARVLELRPGDVHARRRVIQLYRELGQDVGDLHRLRVERRSGERKGGGGQS